QKLQIPDLRPVRRGVIDLGEDAVPDREPPPPGRRIRRADPIPVPVRPPRRDPRLPKRLPRPAKLSHGECGQPLSCPDEGTADCLRTRNRESTKTRKSDGEATRRTRRHGE